MLAAWCDGHKAAHWQRRGRQAPCHGRPAGRSVQILFTAARYNAAGVSLAPPTASNAEPIGSKVPMRHTPFLIHTAAVLATFAGLGASAIAATTVQVGDSGKTFAASAAQCAVNPATGVAAPVVQAGLFNPRRDAEASVSLNGSLVQRVDSAAPSAEVWLAVGGNTVVVALGKRVADRYAYAVTAGQCSLPNTTANFFSADGTLEYAASGKSYLTVLPGCALNPATGLTQPFVNLFDNGSFLLNVSVNGVPLTQLSALRPRVAVFLRAGANAISAANGSLSTDQFVRDGGTGQCVLAP